MSSIINLDTNNMGEIIPINQKKNPKTLLISLIRLPDNDECFNIWEYVNYIFA